MRSLNFVIGVAFGSALACTEPAARAQVAPAPIPARAPAEASAQASGTAGAQPLDKSRVAQEADRQVVAEAADNPHGYPDIPDWRVAPAAGTEFGYGTAFPSLHAPTLQLQGKLGVSIEMPHNLVLILAGQTGATLAFNTGRSSPFYGYLIRVPVEFAPELVASRLFDYRHRRYLNFHTGVSGGGQFLVAAQCFQGACNYIQPSVYWGAGLRVGLSYSAYERSSIGVFVTWQNSFASCPPQAAGSCTTYLSTLTWSIGWTLF